MRHAICYVSNSDRKLEHQQIEELLRFCQDKNKRLGIKGLLIYSEGKFFQILEGDKKVILPLFRKIEKDSRHDGIIQVIGRDIEQGSFDGYKVDIVKADRQLKREIPKEYIEVLHGIPPKVKEPMKRMLSMFIATR